MPGLTKRRLCSQPGERVALEDFAEAETVHLSPLLCWQGLPAAEIRTRIAGLIETIERENAERRMVEGKSLLGIEAVLRQNPHDRPEKLSRSSAPRFHAATGEAWRLLRDNYNAFAAAFREAAEALRAGEPNFEFPPGSFPPSLPYVPHQAPG